MKDIFNKIKWLLPYYVWHAIISALMNSAAMLVTYAVFGLPTTLGIAVWFYNYKELKQEEELGWWDKDGFNYPVYTTLVMEIVCFVLVLLLV